MNIFERGLSKLGYKKHRIGKTSYRRYDAAVTDRLTNDWKIDSLSSDGELKYTLKTLRSRSRDLRMNNDYAKKYIEMLGTNVVGSEGVILQCQARDISGQLDVVANKIIEDSFYQWAHKDFCTVTGGLSWESLQRLLIQSIACDGDILIRKVYGFDNPWRFSLQIFEADYLAEKWNKDLEDGGKIRMGVESDKWGRPVAYWLYSHHPGDSPYNTSYANMLRIPAKEFIFPFISERPGQTRGVPWMVTAMARLRMLGAYEEAEIVASRVSASKMGFFTSEKSDVDLPLDGTDAEGVKITEAEPGTFEELPAGVGFEQWNPDHPNANFGIFMKSTLRGIASGLNISYNSLASDLESTSFSSARVGVIDERDNWRCIQGWFVAQVLQPIYEAWLESALLSSVLVSGNIKLPASKIDKFKATKWHPRGWDWVDPQKDSTANIESIDFGLKTRSEVFSIQGKDIEEQFRQMAADEALAKKYGLVFVAPGKATQIQDLRVDEGNQSNAGGKNA